ncbi:hypothetical protein [Natronobacterium texcoconense]|uniref:Uncharacterized protein n=1 Tax=Natronobacterium texcoconense TaxID=1095778 RepID=A0A1H1I0Y1_NATTX|nr:hypothetical protein [Natronobacterium texcoconense]SDR31377.1 hypothetical protein SAMN04489842_3220 [Natronobacterium texcoconense]
MTEFPKLNVYGKLVALSSLATLGLTVIDGFAAPAMTTAAFAVLVLFVAMYRNEDNSESRSSDNGGGTSDREKEAMVGPAEGDL